MKVSRLLNPTFYWNRIYRGLYLAFRYDYHAITEEETKKLQSLGGKLEEATKKINAIYQEKYGRDFDFKKDSIHSYLWSVVSTSPVSVKRILEIGTFEGEGTYVLAKLFPQAEVVTVDLPEEDPLLKAFYKRDTEERYKAYIEKQKKNIHLSNIKPVKVNSFFLPTHIKGEFDLIWIDGGHLYPEVAWDICNAWNMCSVNGVIMCDDIVPEKKLHKSPYLSTESYETLSYLQERAKTDVTLHLKRRDPSLYPFILKRKYVAFVKKLAK